MNKAIIITIVVILVLMVIALIVGLVIYFIRKNKPIVAPTTIDLSKLAKAKVEPNNGEEDAELVSVDGDVIKDSNTMKMNEYILGGNPESKDFDKNTCGFRGLALLPSGLYLFKRKDSTSTQSEVYGADVFSFTPKKPLSSKAYLIMSEDGNIKLVDGGEIIWNGSDYKAVQGNTPPYTMTMSTDGAVRIKSSENTEIFKSKTVVCTK